MMYQLLGHRLSSSKMKCGDTLLYTQKKHNDDVDLHFVPFRKVGRLKSCFMPRRKQDIFFHYKDESVNVVWRNNPYLF
jgi:hypothetical protein